MKRYQLSPDGTLRAGYTMLPRLLVQLLGGYHKFELENRELFLKRHYNVTFVINGNYSSPKRINYLQETLSTLVFTKYHKNNF